MRKLVIGLVSLVTLGMGAVAVAGPPGMGPEMDILRAIHQLDLTADQKLALKSVRDANRDEHEARRAEREETMAFFKAQLLSDNPDVAAMHDLIDARSIDALEDAHARLDTVIEVHAILTPAQRQQVADLMEDTRESFRARHEAFRASRPLGE
jgi:Spy/CpxP family protein refolding chaperone